MLFTLIHSPFQCDFKAMLRLLQPRDDLLMLQDGVIAALKGTQALADLQLCGARLYVLADDAEARGLSAQISSEIAVVDYDEFIALTVRNVKQVLW